MAQTLFGYELRGGVRLRRARTGPADHGCLKLDGGGRELLSHAGELVYIVNTPAERTTVWRTGSGVLMSCSNTGSYLLDPRRRCVTFDGRPGGEAWEHRLVSTIVPLLLAELGQLALHACAVDGPAGAILFCGPSGRGKSTVAAALAVRGHAVLADDVTVIADLAARPTVWPGPAGVVVEGHVLDALGPRAAEFNSRDMRDRRRRSVHFPTGAHDVAPPCGVCAVVLLSERGGDDAQASDELEILDPVSALPALLAGAVYAGVGHRRGVMHRLARLVERVPVYRVSLPDRLGVAADHAEAVVRRVSESSSSSLIGRPEVSA